MRRMLKPMLVVGFAGGVSALVLGGVCAVALGSDGQTIYANPIMSLAPSGYYHLGELELLETTLFHIEESYVEPARIDYEKMYVAALEAIELRVPTCMFRREPGSSLLHLEVGTTRTTFDVPPIKNRKELQRELQRVATLVENLPKEDVPMDDSSGGDRYSQVEYAMVNGILGTLDPHSRLLPPEASREMDVENQGEFGGLGITLIERNGRLTVEYPLPGTPAEHEGILSDDQIVRIDGESTINMSLEDAVSKLRGPIGAKVTIEILREGLTEPRQVVITRAAIKINPVEGQLLDGDIGYVAIQGFHAQVESDLKVLLARLERESGGLKGLIIDLRDNPGGYLNQAEAVSDLFLERGTIVSTVDSLGRKLDISEAHSSGSEPKYPIAVLVNSGSASASEIVSGALRNNERAVIIGERTYGKGSVQNLHPLFDQSKLKLTISQYLTPGDRSIQAVGIPADIELVPSIVEPGKEGGDPIALLYYRERVRRESDATKHLDSSAIALEEPAYSFRYLRSSEAKRRTSAALDVSGDYEVRFARDVLLTTSSSRRADVLASAGSVVSRYQKQGSKDVEKGFASIGIDWSEGPAVKAADLEVKFDLGPDAVLTAGQEESMVLEVTNRGSLPLYRAAAIATFDGDYTPREFYFGKLMPGETRRYEQKVQLVPGHPTEMSPVTFSFRDVSGAQVAEHRARLPVQGKELPRLVWQVALKDGGDGDGVFEIGEKVNVQLTVENAGKGPTVEAFARVKNKSGKALDIQRGTLEPGTMRAADGGACTVLEAGIEGGNVVGVPATGSERISKGDPPKYAEGCKRSLNPGESWTGSFETLVKQGANGVLTLDLDIGDSAAYDHASVVRAGFYTYFTNHQEIQIPVTQPAAAISKSEPPLIEVTRQPGVVVEGSRASVSGVVQDDGGVAHVEIYLGGDKVFFQGSVKGAHIRSMPFTADLTLKPGLNTVTVLATDESGFTDTSAVVTYYVAPDMAASIVPMGEVPDLKRAN